MTGDWVARRQLATRLATCRRLSRQASEGVNRLHPTNSLRGPWERIWAGKLDMVTPGLAQARIASIKPPTPRMLITRFML